MSQGCATCYLWSTPWDMKRNDVSTIASTITSTTTTTTTTTTIIIPNTRRVLLLGRSPSQRHGLKALTATKAKAPSVSLLSTENKPC
ncbi:hypothetical protein M0802_005950 [Mischocyttarus mexicanus]|nr:hypothetical protein M0802_005950 [Mischocyttarus mexicanus]